MTGRKRKLLARRRRNRKLAIFLRYRRQRSNGRGIGPRKRHTWKVGAWNVRRWGATNTPYDPFTKTAALFQVVNARKWDAVLLTDVTFHRDGTHDLWVDGHKWKLVVEGKVAIAMGEAMGQRWEAGGARSFKSRPGQGRVLGLHFPRQGRRKGLMLIVCYAPISSDRSFCGR